MSGFNETSAANELSSTDVSWRVGENENRSSVWEQVAGISNGPPINKEVVTGLISQLNSDSFPERDNATRQLSQYGPDIVRTLSLGLNNDQHSLEVKRRLERLLEGQLTKNGPAALMPILDGMNEEYQPLAVASRNTFNRLGLTNILRYAGAKDALTPVELQKLRTAIQSTDNNWRENMTNRYFSGKNEAISDLRVGIAAAELLDMHSTAFSFALEQGRGMLQRDGDAALRPLNRALDALGRLDKDKADGILHAIEFQQCLEEHMRNKVHLDHRLLKPLMERARDLERRFRSGAGLEDNQ